MRVPPRAFAVLTAVAGLAVPVIAAVPAQAATTKSATETTTAKTAAAKAADRPQTVPKSAFEVKIKKIIDADTFEVVTAKKVTVRVGLLEAETPEKGRCWYQDALERTTALLPVGKVAYVLPTKEQVTQDGSILLYAWSGRGAFVNGSLVRNGFAQAVAYMPTHKYTDWQFSEQDKAKAESRGMWTGACWAADTYDRRDAAVSSPVTTGTTAASASVEPVDPTPAQAG